MTRLAASLLAVLCALALATPMAASAQTSYPQPQPVTGSAHFTAAQLDQLLAPIALYPDTLLAQVLTAATYPLEIVQADRWLQDPDHAALTGEDLTSALEQQPWDPSVKSLAPFPQVLHMMDDNLTWTEQLGDAFLEQQPAAMDAVQRLRHRAQSAGNLRSTPYDNVVAHDSVIVIESLNPDIVYVPVYDPFVVYGMWPYPDFPPYYFTGYFTVVVASGPGFGWFGFGLVPPLWHWCRWDWEHHAIDVDADRFNSINRRHPPIVGNTWRHDPDHRRGVPYRDVEVRRKFLGDRGIPDARRNFRGYPPPATGTANPNIVQPLAPPVVRPLPQVVSPLPQREQQQTAPGPPPSYRAPSPPAFESFGRGREVRAEAERGFNSRHSTPMPMVRPSEGPRPAAPAAPPPGGTRQSPGVRMQPRSSP